MADRKRGLSANSARDGRARLQVEREGKLWLAKSRTDWWDECRISPKQADRALAVAQDGDDFVVRVRFPAEGIDASVDR